MRGVGLASREPSLLKCEEVPPHVLLVPFLDEERDLPDRRARVLSEREQDAPLPDERARRLRARPHVLNAGGAGRQSPQTVALLQRMG